MENSVNGFLPYKLGSIDHPSVQANLREINEFPETKAECLETLRNELKKLKDIEPCLDENFLLRFLRVSKFNTTKAYQRILKYYNQQEVLLQALKKTSLTRQKARSVNYVWISPYRLKDNSCLAFGLGGKVDYSKVTFAERFYLDILAFNGGLESHINQVAGLTLIFDYKGFSIRSFLAHTPSWTKVFAETILNVFPIRIKSAHIVNAPSLFLAVFSIVYPFFPKKIQERVFVHPNDHWKSLHSVIPPEVLPEVYGGQFKFESCINFLDDIEELEENFHKVFQFGYIKTKKSRQSFRPICQNN